MQMFPGMQDFFAPEACFSGFGRISAAIPACNQSPVLIKMLTRTEVGRIPELSDEKLKLRNNAFTCTRPAAPSSVIESCDTGDPT